MGKRALVDGEWKFDDERGVMQRLPQDRELKQVVKGILLVVFGFMVGCFCVEVRGGTGSGVSGQVEVAPQVVDGRHSESLRAHNGYYMNGVRKEERTWLR